MKGSEYSLKLKQRIIEQVGLDRYDEFLSALNILDGEVNKLKNTAIIAMQETISRCFGQKKFFTGNIVQVDYILTNAAKKILKERKGGKQGKLEHDNALKAQETVFNKYKFFKFEEELERKILDFKDEFDDVFKSISDVDVNILPDKSKFLDDIIASCELYNYSINKKDLKDFIKKYDSTYKDLFVKHKPKPDILSAVDIMAQKLRGNIDFSYDYDNKTGKLLGIPEIVIGELNEIEAAESALNYYIAYSEYFDKQKINIVLQLASNNHFVVSLCHPTLKDDYTRLLTLSENFIADTIFNKFFASLAPQCFDDIDTIKTKTYALENTRSLLISMYSYMHVCTKMFMSEFRETNKLVKTISDNDVINQILRTCPIKFQNYLNAKYSELAKIVDISEENPLDAKRIVKLGIDLDKFISEELNKHSDAFKDYVKCGHEGYKIVIPAGFDINLVKLSAIKPNIVIYGSNFSNVSINENKILYRKREIDIAENVKKVIDKNFADTIGLDAVKQTLFKRTCYLKAFPSNSNFRNLTFLLTGNPGSGKTLSARKIHRVFYETGILTRDEMYEDVAASLKAKFTGQTVEKVESIFNNYRGGTIFLDEAHSLFDISPNSIDNFTNEAKSKFIKMVEDERKNTAIIMAFYKSKLKEVLESDQGLYRRFANRIELPDYTAQQLFDMCQLKLNIDAKETKTQPYVFSSEAQKKLTDYFKFVVEEEKKNEKKENAGIVDRALGGVLAEKVIRSSLDKEISADDVQAFIEEDKENLSRLSSKNKVIGFSNFEQ